MNMDTKEKKKTSGKEQERVIVRCHNKAGFNGSQSEKLGGIKTFTN